MMLHLVGVLLHVVLKVAQLLELCIDAVLGTALLVARDAGRLAAGSRTLDGVSYCADCGGEIPLLVWSASRLPQLLPPSSSPAL
jgi:hypothetical protein